MTEIPAELESKLNTVFRQVFRQPSVAVRRDMVAADVPGWDSISHAEMIAAVEDAFGTKFKLKEITKWKNVGDMVDTLVSRQ